jgi:hypothetical protein
VTETHATAGSGGADQDRPQPSTTGKAPLFPPGRYGRRREPRPPRRRLFAVVVALGLVAILGITVKLFQQYGNPRADATLTRFYDVSDTGISVDFVVHKDSGDLVTCLVQARAKNNDEVGAANVEVGQGDAVTVTYRLATKGRPVTVEVVRCTVEQ